MVKKPPVVATKATYPSDSHEKNVRLLTPPSFSTLFSAAGGGVLGAIVEVFFLSFSGMFLCFLLLNNEFA